jgi:hypothetical protein
VEDLIGGDKHLDFSKPFLPDALVRVQEIEGLNALEKLLLNQIRGNSYLHLSMLLEKFIIPMVLDQVQRLGLSDIYAAQALLCFAEEESKHINMFQRFAEEFVAGFSTACGCIGPAEAIAAHVLRHSPLAVLFLTLQFEWSTHNHYLASVRNEDGEDLDPLFCSLLKNHWFEEAQHTKLDTLLIEDLGRYLNEDEMETGFDDYLVLVKLLNQLLKEQVELDLKSLADATNRAFTETEREEIRNIQEQSYRRSYLCIGMNHPNFVKSLRKLSPPSCDRVIELAKTLASS